MIIRTEQLEAMRLDLTGSIRTRLTRRILADLPNHGLDAGRLNDEVGKMIEDVTPLGITEEEDIYRLLRFQVLSAPLMSSPFIAGVIFRILHILAWSANERLSFLEKQVLPRVNQSSKDVAS